MNKVLVLWDCVVTFGCLGSKGGIEVKGLVRNDSRFKRRILLFGLQLLPVNGGEKTMSEKVVYSIRTCTENKWVNRPSSNSFLSFKERKIPLCIFNYVRIRPYVRKKTFEQQAI